MRDLNIEKCMWYKISNDKSLIYFSSELIKINANLTNDLCAEILTKSLKTDYWNLLNIFENYSTNRNQDLDKFKVPAPNIILESKEKIVACLFQISKRKNATNTFFSLKANDLYVHKEVANRNLQSRILDEKIINGKYLLPELSNLLNNYDKLSFETLFSKSILSVFERFELNENSGLLNPEAIDCISKNTLITESGFEYFDMEYSPNINLTKSHFIFRCAFSFSKQHLFNKRWPYNSPYELYKILCDNLDIKQDVDNNIVSEISFLKPILNKNSRLLSIKELNNIFYNNTPSYIKLIRYFLDKLKLKFNYNRI